MSYIIGILIFIFVIFLLIILFISIYAFALPSKYYITDKKGNYLVPFRSSTALGVNFTAIQPAKPNWTLKVVSGTAVNNYFLETEYGKEGNIIIYRMAADLIPGSIIGLISSSNPNFTTSKAHWTFTNQNSAELKYILQPTDSLTLASPLTLTPQGSNLSTVDVVNLTTDILTIYK